MSKKTRKSKRTEAQIIAHLADAMAPVDYFGLAVEPVAISQGRASWGKGDFTFRLSYLLEVNAEGGTIGVFECSLNMREFTRMGDKKLHDTCERILTSALRYKRNAMRQITDAPSDEGPRPTCFALTMDELLEMARAKNGETEH